MKNIYEYTGRFLINVATLLIVFMGYASNYAHASEASYFTSVAVRAAVKKVPDIKKNLEAPYEERKESKLTKLTSK
jgi:cytochrome b561